MSPTFITVKVPWDEVWEYMMPVVAWIQLVEFDITHGAN